MLNIKCPECKEGNLNFRFDKVEINSDNIPEANIYITCEECSFAEDSLISHTIEELSINCTDFKVKTYRLFDTEGEIDKIRAFSFEEAIEYFRDNFEGEYTIKYLKEEVKVKL